MGKIAFVFAGQGSQAVGMGQDLYNGFNAVKQVFDLSDTIRELCFYGPKESLDITVNTQPALFLTGLACAVALVEKGVTADGAAGFSLGEIPAACFSGLMEPLQAFRFVSYRAAVMQECAEKQSGCMFAVLKLQTSDVESICAGIPQAWPVNYNCPGQTVAACAASSADELEKRVTEAGGRAIKLAVSGAFHSPFMDYAGEKAAEYLKEEPLASMHIPLYANLTARVYDNPKELLAKQINHPVLWQKTIENMVSDGFDTFIEAGPGKTLSGLIKKINGNLKIYNVSDAESLENTVMELNNA